MAGIVIWMAIWWMTECIHLAITSLLPLVLTPFCGIAPIKEVARQYGDSIIFLFLGGFLISIAIEKWDLHKRIARNIIKATGTSTHGLLAGIMIATFLLSNWISNTATALMMFGVIMALIKEINLSDSNSSSSQYLAAALMLGMAYAASIGGMATPVGTPPNMYFFKVYHQLLPSSFSFSFYEWIKLMFPLSVLILAGCFWILKLLLLRPSHIKSISKQNLSLHQKQKISYEEIIVGIIFFVTIIVWITRDINAFGIKGWKYFFASSDFIDDSTIAIASSILLFIIPSKKDQGKRLLEWEDIKQLKYEILLLFGGGFALAYGFEKSGLIKYLVGQLSIIKNIHPLLIVFFISIIVVIISEFASNIASVQLALPIIAAMSLHFPESFTLKLILPCVLSASVGFMLPVATAPNTIAFGSGVVPLNLMLKAGFWLDLFCIFSISLYCYFIL
ncbi:MAG: SLC13 family permease [Bacteroidia bacterium]